LYRPSEKFVEISKENCDLPSLKFGDVVTFAYDHFSRTSILVNPKIVRVRRDVSWEDVLSDFGMLMK
jgi:hypothetical protein